MKFVLAVLIILMGLLPTQAFAWSEAEEAEQDDSYFYEVTYSRCALRYSNSEFSDDAIDCLCGALARHAVDWRSRVSVDRIPPLPDATETACLAAQ